MIKLENVTKSYTVGDQTQVVLEDLSYRFKEGVVTSILGESGCGKTTVLNLIGGIDPDFEGSLLFKDNPITDLDKYRREHVSFIFQDLNLIGNLDLVTNITIGLTNDVENKAEIALELLEQVGLKEHAEKKPNQLSGGERQRVAIARALARKSDVLLCDEPTGSLDEETKVEIMELIMEVFKDKTIIFITHDEELAYKYSHEVIGFENKKIKVLQESQKEEVIGEEKPDTDQSFNGRFEINLLSRKFRLITSSYLIVVIFAIFLFGLGIIKGLENGIDDYYIREYNVDKISLIVPRRLTHDGFYKFVDRFNEEYDNKIIGRMSGANSTLTLEGKDPEFVRLMSLSDRVKEVLEVDLIVGDYPTENNEILYSPGSARAYIYSTRCQMLENPEIEDINENPELSQCVLEIGEMSDEELLTEIQSYDISYRNEYRYNPDRVYDNELTVVGLINDSQYFSYYYDHYTRYVGDVSVSFNHNVYILEEEMNEYVFWAHLGNTGLKDTEYSIFIEEEDLDLRKEVFDEFLFYSHIIAGYDYINDEREAYFDTLQGYKVAVIGASLLLTLFGGVSVYNGIKSNIQRNRSNVGVYKSLGYTSRNIRDMFFKEGLMIASVIILFSLVVWYIITTVMDSYVVAGLDPSNVLEIQNASQLNWWALAGVVCVVVAVILGSIYNELRKINILELIRE